MWANKLSYYALRLVLFFPNLFPRIFLKIIPPFLFFILYKVLKYRKKVVIANLERCFTEKELNPIILAFYKHLSSVISQQLLTHGLGKSFLNSRVMAGNDILEQLYAQKKNVFIVMGHLGNWEWLATTAALKSKYDSTCVYKKISNPFVEKWVNKARTKYGTGLVEMKGVPRLAMEKYKSGKPFLISFIADQIPSHDNGKIVPFFDKPMYFFDGYEKLAKKLKATLVYFESDISNGVYTYTPVIINDFEKTPNYDNAIPDFVKLLEANIKKQPYNWLWSHKRWKRLPQ